MSADLLTTRGDIAVRIEDPYQWLGLTDPQINYIKYLHSLESVIITLKLFWVDKKSGIKKAILAYLVAHDFETDPGVRRTKKVKLTQKLCSDAFDVSEAGMRATLRRLFASKAWDDYLLIHRSGRHL